MLSMNTKKPTETTCPTLAHAELRMSVVLDFVVAERACSHHWRLGGRVVGLLVKGQPV